MGHILELMAWWLLATGFIYSTWEFYCHLMQVFDGQEVIKTMKGKSLRKM